MANTWMHNGFLQVEGEKMSKSVGNFVTIHELLADWPGEVVRLNMLRTHYRQPIDWTVKGLDESWKALAGWTACAEFADGHDENISPDVLDALCDDLNTPLMMSRLHAMSSAGDHAALSATLRALGFKQRPESKKIVDTAVVQSLIAARLDARRDKNFAESDRIRDELVAMGVVLKDGKDPKTGEMTTAWEVGR
jgi:cysteinyl-tRNA synthetase